MEALSGIAPAPAALTSRRGPVRIVLIDDDLMLGTELCRGLNQFDYVVTNFSGYASSRSALLADPPDVMLVDVMLTGESPSNGFAMTTEFFKELGRRIPTIYFTAANDFDTRLSAAMAGGDAFLVKPVQIPVLAERIEVLLQSTRQEAYRVLIVDDDEFLAEHYRRTLCAAGMLAEKVCGARDVLAELQRFNPDLLLLDLYMPECSGAVLARAIRFDPAWQGLPIVYMSAERDWQRQMEALECGADDFLIKPMADPHLVANVAARAARARRIADLTSKDGLTGLLTHASIKERIVQEIVRSRRCGESTAVVMIDIDHFKRINDTYGHPVGDQVIKTLGHLLRLRLRRQDSIGRYGGEEFVALLPCCLAKAGKELVEELRQSFSNIMFSHGYESFSVTLSAGISCTANFSEAPELLAAADNALYVAKSRGRNQVQLAAAPH